MECVSTVSYSLVMNGKSTPRFCPTRGLKQGDPLSLYLFLFGVDVLYRMIKNKVQTKSLVGLKLNKYCPKLTHLFFADDSLFLFFKAKVNCIRMAFCVHDYCCASRQMVNLEKSSIVFSDNTPQEVKTEIERCLRIQVAANSGMFLGISFFWGKTR